MKNSTHRCSQLVPIRNLFHIKQKVEALTKGHSYKLANLAKKM